MDWCTQAKRRTEEKGHPGAEGMERALRKRIADARCEERVFCSACGRGMACVTSGLNVQI